MISIEKFIADLKEAIEELEHENISPETEFRKLPTWSSMYALIILAMIDTNYGVTLTGEELRATNSVSDLYSAVFNNRN